MLVFFGSLERFLIEYRKNNTMILTNQKWRK